jgi:hypothetical protein
VGARARTAATPPPRMTYLKCLAIPTIRQAGRQAETKRDDREGRRPTETVLARQTEETIAGWKRKWNGWEESEDEAKTAFVGSLFIHAACLPRAALPSVPFPDWPLPPAGVSR